MTTTINQIARKGYLITKVSIDNAILMYGKPVKRHKGHKRHTTNQAPDIFKELEIKRID